MGPLWLGRCFVLCLFYTRQVAVVESEEIADHIREGLTFFRTLEGRIAALETSVADFVAQRRRDAAELVADITRPPPEPIASPGREHVRGAGWYLVHWAMKVLSGGGRVVSCTLGGNVGAVG